jgi:hypothetical protein
MSRNPQKRKPFDPLKGKSRRKEWSRPEPYRTNRVILAPRRALRFAPDPALPAEAVEA